MTDRTALSGVTPATVHTSPSRVMPAASSSVARSAREILAVASRLGPRTGGPLSLRREAVQDVRSVRRAASRLLVLGQHLGDDGVGDLFRTFQNDQFSAFVEVRPSQFGGEEADLDELGGLWRRIDPLQQNADGPGVQI